MRRRPRGARVEVLRKEVVIVPTSTLTKGKPEAPSPGPPRLHDAQATRVRRLKVNVAAWIAGTTAVTALWVVAEWQANGAFQSFGHEGNPGQWNPTLWAVVVGLWGLAVGIMALRVHFERPVTAAEVDRAVARADPRTAARYGTADELRNGIRWRLEGVRRLKFHVWAWALGMVMLTPFNLLIEWQDNGAFERWSSNSQPGSWDPWVLVIGGIWALAIAALAAPLYYCRPKTPQART
jgi:hypothetical protein